MTMTKTPESFSISVDTGGTFTDITCAADGRFIAIGKALTTPDRLAGSIHAAIENIAGQLGWVWTRCWRAPASWCLAPPMR